MQYILDEAEMNAIRQRETDARKLPTVEALNNVCRHLVSNYALLGASRAHGCIYDKVEQDRVHPNYTPHYCDDCFVAGICPLEKSWSK